MSHKECTKKKISHLPDVTGSNGVRISTGNPDSVSLDAQFVDSGGTLLSSNESSLRYRNICGSLAVVAFDKSVPTIRSAHAVGFGVLEYGKCVENQRREFVSGVALKPHLDPQTAVHELLGYEQLLNLGINTYVPIGVFPSNGGSNSVLVTEKKSSLVSLDNHFWKSLALTSSEEESYEAENNISIIKKIAVLLANLHVNGIFLPDGQIKNFALNPAGVVGAIDPENIIYKNPRDYDTSSIVISHFEKLIKSLIFKSDNTLDEGSEQDQDKIYGVGFLSMMPSARVRSIIIDILINPYLDELDTHAIQVDSNDNYEFAEQMREEINEFLSHNTNWPSHIVNAATTRSSH